MTNRPDGPQPTLPVHGGLSRRTILSAGLATALGGAAALVARPASAATGLTIPARPGSPASGRPDVAGDWFEQVVATAAAASFPTFGGRVWAISWMSALDALNTGSDRSFSRRQRPRFEGAAVATAVHDALAALVPDQRSTLDTALAASLAAIPDSDAKHAGIRAGQEAAAAMLRDREGDGLDLISMNPPYTLPPEAPGVFRLPPGATRTEGAAWGQARTFLLGSADRFRPDAPPAIGTDLYRQGLDEVRRFGGAISSERTDRQADTALLWAQSPLDAYTSALRPLLLNPGRPTAWKVRLLAAFSTATMDAMTAVAEAKFTYLYWRPVTAIREADTDADPTWSSFVTTPASPEFPSGHAAYAGAAEQVLEHFSGPRATVPFTISVTRPTGEVVSRDHPRGTRWSTLTQENIDARVWAGVHWRSSDEIGATLGRNVADYDLRQLDLTPQ